MDGGTLTLGNDEARGLIVEECCFIMPRAAEKGFVAPPQITDGRTIIALSETILGNERDAVFTVLHEVPHHYLGHKVGLLEDMTAEDDVRQEQEANRQAREWLDAADRSPPS